MIPPATTHREKTMEVILNDPYGGIPIMYGDEDQHETPASCFAVGK